MSSLDPIYKYRQPLPDIATSGQPTESQIVAIAAAGYPVIINLALHDDPRYSLRDEAATVRSAGMEYIHIPVKFDGPTQADLQTFFEAMDKHSGGKIWIHCAANIRVSVFLGLYLVIRKSEAQEIAFEQLVSLWQPDAVWSAFITESLANRSLRTVGGRP